MQTAREAICYKKQEAYAPSSITNAKINYEHDVDSGGVHCKNIF